jgi:chloramphenicol 3-O phosphotransferase
MKPGIVIILNGPSSSGKSSIQKEFQKLTEDVYLATGIDDFHVMLPEHYIGERTPNDQGINVNIYEDEGHRVLEVKFGTTAQRIIKGMHESIAALAKVGNNIIVDYIQYDVGWIEDCMQSLNGYKVYLIGVYCSLEELERRERKRSLEDPEREGIMGHARSHYHTVHNHCKYDLIIHSDKRSPYACAEEIFHFISSRNEETKNQ